MVAYILLNKIPINTAIGEFIQTKFQISYLQIFVTIILTILGAVLIQFLLYRKRFAMIRKDLHTDELTGLPNKKALDTELKEILTTAKKEGKNLSIILMDIDDFKKFNTKAIYIESNTYRVHSDVVPAFQFRNFRNETKNNPNDFIEGVKFFTANSDGIVNYPKIHVKNGIAKNDNTLRRFKRTVRLYKRIRNKMKEDGIPVSENIRSFLIESLLWNVPNTIFNSTDSWNDILRNSIISLYNRSSHCCIIFFIPLALENVS